MEGLPPPFSIERRVKGRGDLPPWPKGSPRWSKDQAMRAKFGPLGLFLGESQLKSVKIFPKFVPRRVKDKNVNLAKSLKNIVFSMLFEAILEGS